jgi:predicted transcriptional regulator of viral defense system
MGKVGVKQMTRQEKWDRDEAAIRELVLAKGGVVKTSELYTLGIDYRRINRFVDWGLLTHVKNGYYSLCEQKLSDDEMIWRMFGEDGVLTMESALYVYGYLSAKPREYQIAVDKNTSKSRFRMNYPFVHPYYSEEKVLKLGVAETSFGGGTMKIYDKDRLICDCLKYEDRLDREDLKKALRAYLAEPDKDISRLLDYAAQRKVLTKVQNRIGAWL